MILALLQPGFAPNLYDLACMLQADKIILQDNEEWSRKGRTHRAKIRTPDGTQWINIPVETEDRKKQIRHVRINHAVDWIDPLLKTLKYNYRNSIYYDFYEPEIQADFRSAVEYEYLLPFTLYLRKRFFQFMELELELNINSTLASQYPYYDEDPDKLVTNARADAIMQEHDSRHYMRQAEEYYTEPDFSHPVYHQHFEGFESDCCLLDVLFQFGPESFRITDQLLPNKSCPDSKN